jgi:hypothetical protein
MTKHQTRDLYTPKDVKEVRELLLKEQYGIDVLTNTPVLPNQGCLDHSHDNLFVRAVLNRQTNAALGKLEGIYTRYLRHWYDGTLSDFLRGAAAYLERPVDKRWRHPHFLRKLKTSFNKLSEKDKGKVLAALGKHDGGNSTQRKKIFASLIMQRELGFTTIDNLIKEISNVKLR